MPMLCPLAVSTLVFETESLSESEAGDWLDWLASEFCLCLRTLGLQVHTTTPSLLHESWESKLRSSGLCQSTLPAEPFPQPLIELFWVKMFTERWSCWCMPIIPAFIRISKGIRNSRSYSNK